MKLLFLMLCTSSISFATVWQVGPTRTYTLPSQVSTLVQNNDTVEIDAGVYFQNVCGWYANNLVLRGVNGMAHLQANFTGYQGKAIWVLGGNNIKVEYIEFSECAVPSQNGAGIRQEGMDLTVEHCYFHDNENGILAGTVANSTIKIRFTEFARNGFGDGLTHNLYINNIDTLIFEYNYSHHANIGHELKSRAHVNIIRYNRLSNESTGNASREVDLPNGGRAYLIGNIIHQGTNSTNSNMLGYGLEGLTNPGPHNIYVVNNTFVNERPTASFLQFNTSTALYKGYNNIFAGSGNYVNGSFPASIDTASNWRVPSIPAVGFQNSANYDYRLINGSSPARDNATTAGVVNAITLDPVLEYSHPANFISRCVSAPMDLGAHEFCLTNLQITDKNTDIQIYQIESGTFFINQRASSMSVFGLDGKELCKFLDIEGNFSAFLTTGIYLLHVVMDDKTVVKKMFVR